MLSAFYAARGEVGWGVVCAGRSPRCCQLFDSMEIRKRPDSPRMRVLILCDLGFSGVPSVPRASGQKEIAPGTMERAAVKRISSGFQGCLRRISAPATRRKHTINAGILNIFLGLIG